MIPQSLSRAQDSNRVDQPLDATHGLKRDGLKRPKHKMAQHHLSGRVQVIIMAILPRNIATRTVYGEYSCAPVLGRPLQLSCRNNEAKARKRLRPLIGLAPALSLKEGQYIELVQWTGQQVRPNKKGAIPKHAPFALSKTGCSATH